MSELLRTITVFDQVRRVAAGLPRLNCHTSTRHAMPVEAEFLITYEVRREYVKGKKFTTRLHACRDCAERYAVRHKLPMPEVAA